MDSEKANIKLEIYEGPLDLLLALIAKNEIDIYDIPIFEITKQYMQYLYRMNELNIALAGEFVVMAAQLIEIKSKMMLPKDEEEATEEDPREALVRRLAEYKIFKLISEYIRAKEPHYNRVLTKQQEYYPELKNDYADLSISSQLLSEALVRILKRFDIRINNTFSYSLEHKEISTEEKMAEIVEMLNSKGRLDFFSLFGNDCSKANIIASFMAVLELIKKRLIDVEQINKYGDITIIPRNS